MSLVSFYTPENISENQFSQVLSCILPVQFNFIINFTYSDVFNVKFEHISNLERRKKCRNMLFILEKERKVRSTDCKLKCFFLPNISLPHTPQGLLTGFYGILNRRNYVLIVNNFIIQLSGTSIFGCRETEAYLHMVYISREVTSNQKQIIEAT